MSALAILHDSFRREMIEAVGECGTYDALAILGYLMGQSGGVVGLGADGDFHDAVRAMQGAILGIVDQQLAGAIPNDDDHAAGFLVTGWLGDTMAEIEHAQLLGFGTWAEAIRALA